MLASRLHRYRGVTLEGSPVRVLLIEDDAVVSRSIQLMLKAESFSVFTTELGEEGSISGSCTTMT